MGEFMGKVLALGIMAVLGCSGIAHAGEMKRTADFQMENGVKVYRNSAPATKVVAGVRVTEFPPITNRMRVNTCYHPCARTAESIEDAYARGFEAGIRQSAHKQYRRAKRPIRRRYSTYLGLSPYQRHAYRGIYGRPIRARTAHAYRSYR